MTSSQAGDDAAGKMKLDQRSKHAQDMMLSEAARGPGMSNCCYACSVRYATLGGVAVMLEQTKDDDDVPYLDATDVDVVEAQGSCGRRTYRQL